MNHFPVRQAQAKRVIQIVDASAALQDSDTHDPRAAIAARAGMKRSAPAPAAKDADSEPAAAEAPPAKLSAATKKRLAALSKAGGSSTATGSNDLRRLTREIEDVAVENMTKQEKRAHEARRWKEVTGMAPAPVRHHRRFAQELLARKHARAVSAYEEAKDHGLEAANPTKLRRVQRHQQQRKHAEVVTFGTNVADPNIGGRRGKQSEEGGIFLSKKDIRSVSAGKKGGDIKLQNMFKRR